MTSLDHDTRARASIAGELDSTLVVVAGAGTGKTTALVGRIVELVRSGRAALREIAAITFTEVAAAELRQRIRARIDEVALEHPDEARLAAACQEVDEAAISTLHAFAQRILVEHCVAAGIPPGFEVLDETAERADFEARFERFADTLLADPDAEPALVRGLALGLSHDDMVEIARALHRHWDRLEDGGLASLEQMRGGARLVARRRSRTGPRGDRHRLGHGGLVQRRPGQAARRTSRPSPRCAGSWRRVPTSSRRCNSSTARAR